MKDPRTIIRKVLLTEKGTAMKEKENQYLFEVSPDANKIEIRLAVEKLFKVKVTKVNTLNRSGKQKRLRTMKYGWTADSKRAIVTLKEGDKIEFS
ncbi:MAG TPA: 50S ribosomal protein L23 [Kiritimatiellia bacterium]|nr:50S ribosomal protein L23 [Kiritimatiellia bacterium]HRZ13662.1 50S ribosomal protein L23 [Kiritimatiellia bacterium]HSA19242.1 50S ribosomal protein L23 [Kiritimatiellia bacterium]